MIGEDFLGRLGKLSQEEFLSVYAWILLDNHFHLLILSQRETISAGMRKFLTGYAVSFNRRYHRSGHLFRETGLA